MLLREWPLQGRISNVRVHLDFVLQNPKAVFLNICWKIPISVYVTGIAWFPSTGKQVTMTFQRNSSSLSHVLFMVAVVGS